MGNVSKGKEVAAMFRIECDTHDRKMKKHKLKKPTTSIVYEDAMVVSNAPNNKLGRSERQVYDRRSNLEQER